jgi:hypothetical protein
MPMARSSGAMTLINRMGQCFRRLISVAVGIGPGLRRLWLGRLVFARYVGAIRVIAARRAFGGGCPAAARLGQCHRNRQHQRDPRRGDQKLIHRSLRRTWSPARRPLSVLVLVRWPARTALADVPREMRNQKSNTWLISKCTRKSRSFLSAGFMSGLIQY